MYYRVLQDELQFPEDRTMDQDTKSLIRGVSVLAIGFCRTGAELVLGSVATPT